MLWRHLGENMKSRPNAFMARLLTLTRLKGPRLLLKRLLRMPGCAGGLPPTNAAGPLHRAHRCAKGLHEFCRYDSRSSASGLPMAHRQCGSAGSTTIAQRALREVLIHCVTSARTLSSKTERSPPGMPP